MRTALIFSTLILRDSGEGDDLRTGRVKKGLESNPLHQYWNWKHDYGVITDEASRFFPVEGQDTIIKMMCRNPELSNTVQWYDR
jgi:hypothetical protein